MAVAYELGSIQTELGAVDRAWTSNPIVLFGANPEQGLWIRVVPVQPQVVGNLLGYVWWGGAVIGAPVRSGEDGAAVVEDVGTLVFPFPASRGVSFVAVFYPVRALLTYNVSVAGVR